jgi:hypothetical protein
MLLVSTGKARWETYIHGRSGKRGRADRVVGRSQLRLTERSAGERDPDRREVS